MRAFGIVAGVVVSMLMAAPVVRADVVKIALVNQPPYMIEENGGGIFIDVIREVMAAGGHEVVFQFLPNKRAFSDFEDKQIAGVYYYVDNKAPESCSTKAYGIYDTVAISLKKNNLTAGSFKEMEGHTVSAFLGAKDYFAYLYGPSFAESMAKATYKEEADISRITKLLLNDRLDYGILDWRIFAWTARKDADQNRFKVEDATRHPFLKKSEISLQFHDKKYCEAFDKGLADLQNSGRFKAIYDAYAN